MNPQLKEEEKEVNLNNSNLDFVNLNNISDALKIEYDGPNSRFDLQRTELDINQYIFEIINSYVWMLNLDNYDKLIVNDKQEKLGRIVLNESIFTKVKSRYSFSIFSSGYFSNYLLLNLCINNRKQGLDEDGEEIHIPNQFSIEINKGYHNLSKKMFKSADAHIFYMRVCELIVSDILENTTSSDIESNTKPAVAKALNIIKDNIFDILKKYDFTIMENKINA